MTKPVKSKALQEALKAEQEMIIGGELERIVQRLGTNGKDPEFLMALAADLYRRGKGLKPSQAEEPSEDTADWSSEGVR